MRTDYSIKIGKVNRDGTDAIVIACGEGPMKDASARGYSTCYLLKVGPVRDEIDLEGQAILGEFSQHGVMINARDAENLAGDVGVIGSRGEASVE